MRRSDALRIFGYPSDAEPPEKELRKKYLSLSRTHHPDKGGDSARFKDIQAAYSLLTEEESSGEDTNFRSGFPFRSKEEAEKDAFFQGIFGGFNDIFSKFGEARQNADTPTVKTVRLKVHELFRGTTRNIIVQESSVCSMCDGTGTGSRVQCADCKGKGAQVTHRKIPMGTQTIKTMCSTCNGRGGIGEGSERKCTKCMGHRIVIQRTNKNVRIPKGLPNGTKIMVQDGDRPTVLQIKYPSALDKNWGDWVLGKDRVLRISKEVSLETALLGGSVDVIHPGTSETIKVPIPAGIQPGDEVILKDKGLPACPEAKIPPSNGAVQLQVRLPKVPEKHRENTRRFLSALQR